MIVSFAGRGHPTVANDGKAVVREGVAALARRGCERIGLWRPVTPYRQTTPEMVQKLEANSPLGRVLATGLRQGLEGREIMKEAMEETGRAVAHDLERSLGALGTLAAVAPLLGLFGTVIGMIEIFGAQSPQGTNPAALAHGISVALYNTALGLVVAIPALIAYRAYRSRVDGFLVEMEQQSLRLVDTLDPRRRPPMTAPLPQTHAAAAPAR